MRFVVDTHTHTYASGHAYSTIIENARAAADAGLKILCTTDHSELMPGAPHPWFFANQRVLPRFLEGVGIIRGVESNIMNRTGEIDVAPHILAQLDWVIGSFHDPVFAPANKSDHTEALLNTMQNGQVDALGHLGNPKYDFDFEAVLLCAKKHNVAIEINNSTLLGHSRVGSVERCYEIATIGKEIGNYFTTGSDAHFCSAIGQLDLASTLLETVGVDTSQVITHSVKQFLDFLTLRGHSAIDEFASLAEA